MKKLWGSVKWYFRTTDKWLWLLWVSASLLSILFLAGIVNSGLSHIGKLWTQVAATGIGICLAVMLSLIDYKTMLKLWKLYVPLCVVLVALTFFIGSYRGNDQAWLIFSIAGKSVSIQPSEFLKISFITTFAMHISKVGEDLNKLGNIALLCLHGGAHILLIQRQDSGTALIFLCIFIIMFFCAGLKWRYILAAAAGTVAAAPLLWFKILTDDQKMRILIVLNPSLDADYAYQQINGLKALGVGGIRGTGIFSGSHIPVPEVYNDFIFSFIGEACGFIGAFGVILLLLVIAFKIFYNSRLAENTTGRMICTGVFAMFISQIFVNLGMCLSIMPVIGVTLPLLSSGGSSVLSLYAGLGLVLSIYSHVNTSIFSNKNK